MLGTVQGGVFASPEGGSIPQERKQPQSHSELESGPECGPLSALCVQAAGAFAQYLHWFVGTAPGSVGTVGGSWVSLLPGHQRLSPKTHDCVTLFCDLTKLSLGLCPSLSSQHSRAPVA